MNNINVQSPHRCAVAVIRKIKKDFNVNKAVFIGRSYDEPGDIKLFLADNKTAYVELKLVEYGKGTRANLGQDILTELKLFSDGRVLSWSEFRKRRNFDNIVLEKLNQYKYYDKASLSKYKGSEKERKGRFLRDLLKPRPGEAVETVAERSLNNPDPRISEAAKIVKEILEIARLDKLEYIKYLRSLKQDPENIKRFVILVLSGVHKEDIMKTIYTTFDRFIENLLKGMFIYKTYYVKKKTCEICVEDLTLLISKLVKSKDFRITFPANETNIVIEFFDPDTKSWRRFLRIVFHWKNVFQGIATPCLNIFDEEILRETCIFTSA